MGNSNSVVQPPLEEEENMSFGTPTGCTRILSKMYDPRSPTEGIFRTPIEVVCTPKINNDKNASSKSICETPTSTKCEFNVAKGTVKLSKLDFEDEPENLESVKPTEEYTEVTELATDDKSGTSSQPQILEKDIDNLEDDFKGNVHVQHPRVKQLKKNGKTAENILQTITNKTSQEDHSASEISENLFKIVLTPRDQTLSKSDYMEHSEGSISELSLAVSSDIENENESVKSSVSDTNIEPSDQRIHEWLITIEDDSKSLVPFNIITNSEISDYHESPKKGSIKKDTIHFSFYSPGHKENNSSLERTPLGCLKNQATEPNKGCGDTTGSKKKQWRGFEEERKRRGLLDVENTPPSVPPPFVDQVSSAPGKLMRRRKILDRDQENPKIFV